jgi:hypothetical protein
MKLKNAADSGMIAKNTMVVPCIVNNSLNVSALTTVLFGDDNCTRMTSASRPPRRKNAKALTP